MAATFDRADDMRAIVNAILTLDALAGHARLDRVIAGQGYRGDFLRPDDMVRIEDGVRAALGL